MTTAQSTSTKAVMMRDLPAHDAKQDVLVNSEDFERYLKLLLFLKDPKSIPIIAKLNPKMCITCWQIFTDKEKDQHL